MEDSQCDRDSALQENVLRRIRCRSHMTSDERVFLMRTHQLLVTALMLSAVACGSGPQSPAGQPAAAPAGQPPAAPAKQLGAAPTGAGTVTADAGEIQPADPTKFYKEPGYSPYAGRRYPERPYFGDEHVHTAWSMDAGGFGTTLTPEEATRFARGEEVKSTSGQPVKLGEPLDWVAITDHSDGMGVITEIKSGNPELLKDPTIKKWYGMFSAGPAEAKAAVMELIQAQATKKLPPAFMDPKFARKPVDEEYGDRRKVQRAGAIHRLYRLRVDVERRRRRQPASEHHLPRRQGQGGHGAALHDVPE